MRDTTTYIEIVSKELIRIWAKLQDRPDLEQDYAQDLEEVACSIEDIRNRLDGEE